MSKTSRCVAISALLTLGQVQFAACANSAKRDFVPLSEPEISKALTGQRLAPDRKMDWHPNKTSIGFAEKFLPDGSWIITRAIRGVITEKGVWRTRDGKLCTRVTPYRLVLKGRQEVCRHVWRDGASGKIVMPEDSSRNVFLIFLSTPLK